MSITTTSTPVYLSCIICDELTYSRVFQISYFEVVKLLCDGQASRVYEQLLVYLYKRILVALSSAWTHPCALESLESISVCEIRCSLCSMGTAVYRVPGVRRKRPSLTNTERA